VPKETLTDCDNKDVSASDASLDALRHLILQPEQDKIAQLQQRLDDTASLAQEISHILPNAIEQSRQQGEQLSDALMPTVEDAVKASVTKDISTFADALYPVMGPAIRRSIAEAFKEMLQSLNVTMENSFSRQGLQWRLESMRTGKSFSEIVLLRSLEYRVEQVFLIHRETGALLQHIAIDMEADSIQDADMVSGMLTAITDFAQDSFDIESQSTLDSINIDDLTVLIESGPQAILAVAIRGTAPENIREILRHALELTHHNQGYELVHFEGDAAPFEESKPYLESCLKAQYKEKSADSEQEQGKEKKQLKYLGIILLLFSFLFAGWSYHSYQNRAAWHTYIQQLKKEPGIIVTDVQKIEGGFSIIGLHDPLALRPEALLPDAIDITQTNIQYQLEPYQSLLPNFILQRATQLLNKPKQINFSLNEQGQLIAQGIASLQWQKETQQSIRFVTGLTGYNDTQVTAVDLSTFNAPKTVTLSYDNKGTLSATGTAAKAWIDATMIQAQAHADIHHYDQSQLTSAEQIQLAQRIKYIEALFVLFKAGSATETSQMLNDFALNAIHELQSLAQVLDLKIIIHIVGHTDTSGNRRMNIKLRQQRANFIYQFLIDAGINAAILLPKGKLALLPMTDSNKKYHRSVTFQIKQPAL